MNYIIYFGIFVFVLSIIIFSKFKDQREDLNAVFENPTVKFIDSVALIISGIVAFGMGYPSIFGVYLLIKGIFFLYMSYKIISKSKRK